MNNRTITIFFFFLMFLAPINPSVFAQAGCTDPLADNFDESANSNDGSCIYPSTNYMLDFMATLTGVLEESSGLVFNGSDLWTFSDSGSPNKLYRIDSLSGSIQHEVTIDNASNVDWEDITADDDYIYIGDFGNNAGNRMDLTIYRIAKNGLNQDAVNAQVITFTYSDQTDFTSSNNNNDYDCEAMFYFDNQLHLFSKNWVNQQTRHYTLPATPGNHVAQLQNSYNVNGLITAADISEDGVVSLLGYTSSGATFMWLLFDYQNSDFFSGNKRRIGLGSTVNNSQTEGIAFKEGGFGYISAESFSFLPARILSFQTDQWTNSIISSNHSLEQIDFKAFPNPFESNIIIQSPQQLSTPSQVQLINNLGQIVWSSNKVEMIDNELTLHIDNDLPFGNYFLQIKNEEAVGYVKLMKK